MRVETHPTTKDMVLILGPSDVIPGRETWGWAHIENYKVSQSFVYTASVILLTDGTDAFIYKHRDDLNLLGAFTTVEEFLRDM